jgi:hypothetical protein
VKYLLLKIRGIWRLQKKTASIGASDFLTVLY